MTGIIQNWVNAYDIQIWMTRIIQNWMIVCSCSIIIETNELKSSKIGSLLHIHFWNENIPRRICLPRQLMGKMLIEICH